MTGHVTIVEDHGLIAHTVATGLRSRGLHVEVVDTTRIDDVIAAVAASVPDVVLLDLDLGAAGDATRLIGPLRALGAEVVLVPQAEGAKPGEVSGADLALVETEARRITRARGAFRADQFVRAGNPEAHATGTAPEIWEQSSHAVTAFCDFIGSGGTVGGAARFFAPLGVRCYAVRPDRTDHPIQGGGYEMPDLVHLKGTDLAGDVTVSGPEAAEHARLLARREGIFGGYSAGANLAAAIHLLQGPEKGGCVAFVICDSGLKYLSTDLWEA